jgi:AcrR family transcriptional regulator
MKSPERATKRRYELRKRAESQAETRRRITEATVELHRTVGPAATRISDVARRAGVQRVTVYNHFPDLGSLIAACSAHWRALHPRPDPQGWLAIADPAGRLRHALREVYAWYRETEPMAANLLRDAALVPELRPYVQRGFADYVDAAATLLTDWVPAGRERSRTDAAARVALGFHTWQALTALGDDEAAELSARFVEVAAAPSHSSWWGRPPMVARRGSNGPPAA